MPLYTPDGKKLKTITFSRKGHEWLPWILTWINIVGTWMKVNNFECPRHDLGVCLWIWINLAYVRVSMNLNGTRATFLARNAKLNDPNKMLNDSLRGKDILC